jgi:hypothetical protein
MMVPMLSQNKLDPKKNYGQVALALGSMYRSYRRTGKKYIQIMRPLHTAHLHCINF